MTQRVVSSTWSRISGVTIEPRCPPAAPVAAVAVPPAGPTVQWAAAVVPATRLSSITAVCVSDMRSRPAITGLAAALGAATAPSVAESAMPTYSRWSVASMPLAVNVSVDPESDARDIATSDADAVPAGARQTVRPSSEAGSGASVKDCVITDPDTECAPAGAGGRPSRTGIGERSGMRPVGPDAIWAEPLGA